MKESSLISGQKERDLTVSENKSLFSFLTVVMVLISDESWGKLKRKSSANS